MRLYEYMKLSSDNEDIAKFRTMSFRLVKSETSNRQLLESIDEGYKKQVLTLLQGLNTELKKVYTGMYRFDLCVDEGNGLDVLKIKRKYSKVLNMLCFEYNDLLSKIKKDVEINLTENKDK